MANWVLLLMALASGAAVPASQQLSGNVFVQDDGSLRVQGHAIELFGIYIPITQQECFTFVRPPLCGPRAIIALKFKLGADFVHCEVKSKSTAGEITAICRDDEGEDLAAWMLEQGWALALPDAPFEYKALEKIARYQGRGIWGFPSRVPPLKR